MCSILYNVLVAFTLVLLTLISVMLLYLSGYSIISMFILTILIILNLVLLGKFIQASCFERQEDPAIITYTDTILIVYPIVDEISNKEEKQHIVFENPDQTLVISVV